jgi:hypothetical protein
MKFSEMIDKRTSLNEDEMKFNEMKFKRTSLNDREMKSNEMKFRSPNRGGEMKGSVCHGFYYD